MSVEKIRFNWFNIDYGKWSLYFHYLVNMDGTLLIANREFTEFWTTDSLKAFAEYISKVYNTEEEYKINYTDWMGEEE